MNIVSTLFDSEGLSDQFKQLAASYTMKHAEDFLKLSRDVDITEPTYVFGQGNRLHLIKNKMKTNDSFGKYVTLVDVKNITDWTNNMIQTPVEDEETEAGLPEEIVGDTADDVYVDNVQPIKNYGGATHRDNDNHYETDNVGKDLHSGESDGVQNIQTETGNEKSSCANSNAFVFEYHATEVPITRIACGFTIHDVNPKEVANEFIKRLSVI